MKKFLVTYHSPAAVLEGMAQATPAQKAEGMKPWMAWKAKHDANIVDFGAPLMGGLRLDKSDTWQASNKEVSGFSVVQAKDKEEAKLMFRDHPHVVWAEGCSVEIHEAIAM